jgi:phosphoglycerate kinase
MNLKSVRDLLPGTRVVLRMDLDVADGDNSRLEKSIPTIKLLLEKKCRVVIIGHKGRPEGKDEEYSLRSVYLDLMSMLEPSGENLIESVFIDDISNKEKIDQALVTNQIVFLENLRFWKGEESNDPDFLKGLIEITQFYVNDAISVAHRKHRSIMLYKNLPGFYGLAFIDEVEKILKVTEDPKRPLTVILGGAKEDKLKYLEELEKIADNVLIGGKLPQLIGENNVVVAKLREDGFDLSDEDIENFKKIIAESGMIVWAGAMGWFEKTDCQKGTLEIAKAVAESPAYKIIAGGDTGASIKNLGLLDKIDLIASGGGMMLELLAKGRLPAWE